MFPSLQRGLFVNQRLGYIYISVTWTLNLILERVNVQTILTNSDVTSHNTHIHTDQDWRQKTFRQIPTSNSYEIFNESMLECYGWCKKIISPYLIKKKNYFQNMIKIMSTAVPLDGIFGRKFYSTWDYFWPADLIAFKKKQTKKNSGRLFHVFGIKILEILQYSIN